MDRDTTDDKDTDETDADALGVDRRILAILSSPSGRKFPALAMWFALDSRMTAAEAVELMDAVALIVPHIQAPAQGRASLRSRMNAQPDPDIGDGGEDNAPTSLAEFIVRADRKRPNWKKRLPKFQNDPPLTICPS